MEALFRQNFAEGAKGVQKNEKNVYNPGLNGQNKACTLEIREEVCFMQNNNNGENNQNERSQNQQNKQQNEQRNQKENRK